MLTATAVPLFAVTVTEAVPDALVYTPELALSGVYVAFSVSEPGANDPAGIEIVADPELRVVAAEV
jgi:hypothetical protein